MKGTPIDIYVEPNDVELTGTISKNGEIKRVSKGSSRNYHYHSTMISLPNGLVTTIKNQKFNNPDIMTIMQDEEPYALSSDCIGLRFSTDEEHKRQRITLVIDKSQDRIICIIYTREYELDDSDIPYMSREICRASIMTNIEDPNKIVGTEFETIIQLTKKYKYAVVFKDHNTTRSTPRRNTEGCDVYLFDGNNELTHIRGTITKDEGYRKTYLTLNDD